MAVGTVVDTVVGAVVGTGMALAHPPRIEAIATLAMTRSINCVYFNSHLLIYNNELWPS